MRKLNDVLCVLIQNSFFCARKNILGRELNTFAKIAIKDMPNVMVDCVKKVKFPEEYDYLAVLYEDMPLISAKNIYDGCRFLKSKGYDKVGLGNGFICNRDGFLKDSPDCIINDINFLSVSDTISLKIVYNELRKRIIYRHLENGVIIFDDNVQIDDTVQIEKGATIEGDAKLCGNTVIRQGAHIKSSRIEDSFIGQNTTVGPYSYIRMNSEIGNNVRIGDFVEIKKSKLNDNTKVAHLCYIGDAEVGKNTNVGCGTVFCNFDGVNKNKTYVGNNVFIGANTNLIAPVSVGDNVFIAAGTTVTNDLDDDAFCIGRVKQTVKEKRK